MVNFGLERLFVNDYLGAGHLADIGLGKTVVTLKTLERLFEFGEVERVLITAPKRVRDLVWPEEMELWSSPLSHAVLAGNYEKCMRKNAQVEIATPDSLPALRGYTGRWDMIVCDEIDYYSNWSGTRTKGVRRRRGSRMPTLRRMLPSFPKRIGLTGTPATDNLGSFFPLNYIMDDGEALGSSITYFRSQFMIQGGWQGRQWFFNPMMRDRMLDLLAPIWMRTDHRDHLELPKVLPNTMRCELPPACRREYQRLKRDLLAQLESGDVLAENAVSAYAKCRQFANGAIYDDERVVHHVHDAKLAMLEDLIGELNGKPLLVFYQFHHDRDRILARIKSAKAVYGATPKAEAKELFDAWNKGQITVLLLHCQSGSHGLNLQKCHCSDVAWFGLTNRAKTYVQANGRVARQGNDSRHIRAHRLLTAGTLEATMAEKVDGKFATEAAFLHALKTHARSAWG